MPPSRASRLSRLIEWRIVLGPLVAALSIVLVGLYRGSAIYNPDIGEWLVGALLIAGVVFAAAYSGLWPAVVSAIAAAFAAFAVNVGQITVGGGRIVVAATNDQIARALFAAGLVLGLGVVVGWLKENFGRQLASERARRAVAFRRRAEAVAAEAEIGPLRESETRFQELAGNIREVLWVADAGLTRMLYVSPAYAEMWGHPVSELYQNPRAWVDVVDPADRDRVLTAIDGAASHPTEVEYKIHRDGATRWIWSRVYPVRDGRGTAYRLVGVSDDITQRKHTEQEREQLLQREKEARQQVTTILERITDGFVAADGEWRVEYINATARTALPKLLRRDLGDMMGQSLWVAAPELVGTAFEEKGRLAMATQEPVHLEQRFEPSGAWLDINLYPSSRGMTIYFRDVSERKRVEEERLTLYRETQKARRDAEAARDEARDSANRFAFLAEASTALASSLDYTDTLRGVARLAVPRMSDFCVVDIRENNAEVRRVAAAHRDAAVAAQLERHEGLPLRPGSPLDEVLRVGQTKLIEAVDEQLILSLARSLSEVDALRRLAPQSLMIVPLVSRGTTLGAITFASTSRRYGPADASLAEEVARRAAVGVDNARLYKTALVASGAKSDFLAVMSHELRTPLNAILGYTDLLRLGVPEAVPKSAQVNLDRILTATRHLLQLIEEILTFSRLEAGREEVRLEDVDLTAIVHDVVAMTQPLVGGRAVRVEALGLTEQTMVRTDPRKLRQILINLMSNAAKFTDRGDITLGTTIDKDRITMRVRDTGIGIPAEHLEHIFNPFWQVEQDPRRRRVSGTGLGLSVSRQLARLMGGDIEVESAPGKGTTFTVTLPVLSKVPEAREQTSGRPTPARASRPVRSDKAGVQ